MESSAERPHHKGAFISVHQPSAAPGPVAGNRINEHADKDSIDQIHGELGTFCHGTGHDGGRRGAEYSLENQEAFDGQSVVDDFVHRLQVEKMGGAHKTAYAEHQPEADEPEQDGAEHEVYQIFHQHVGRVLGTDEPGFYQGKSRLHEEYQHGGK